MSDKEIDQMQADWLTRNRETTRWIIVAEPEGFSVHQHSIDGVAPQSTYLTAYAAVARIAQLLGVKEPVTPQNWPESVCIGSIEAEEPNGAT